MQSVKLNLSQREIAESEVVNVKKNAVNTISVKIYLPDISALEAEKAVNSVLQSADVFFAVLDTGTEEWKLMYTGQVISPCHVTEGKTEEEARRYMEKEDRSPLHIDRELYRAQVIPLEDRGSLVYVRFHHIITDGYGMSLFAQRIFDVLENRCVKESDFSVNAETGEALSDSEFWQNAFDEADFNPEFFSEKAEGTEFFSCKYKIEEPLLEQLKAFSQREKLTPAYVFASAYALYLAESTGKKEAVILMPRLNRTEQTRDVIGCYTLLIPVRITINPDESFSELCHRMSDVSREASEHKDCGYSRILTILRDNNIISEKLSDYVFNFYRYHFHTELIHHVEYSVAGGMHNHLTCNIFCDEQGGFDICPDYHKGVYTEERAAFFFDSLCTILRKGLTNARVADIPILGEKEYRKIMSVHGKTYDVSEELTIPSLFRETAKKYPDAYALHAGENSFTFRELDVLSDRIAGALIEKGVRTGDSVAFMLNRDWHIIPVILGISKSGAAFIPVDPEYPKDRVSYIIENSEAAMLISSKEVESSKDYEYTDVALLTGFVAEETVLPDIRQEDIAYIIYTSGTTGKPKGVMLSHRGIANIVHPDNNPFNRDITKNCHGIVAIGSICFDISLFEIFVPLLNGLFVEFGNEKAMVDAGELAACIARHQADIIHCTPSRIAAYLTNKAFIKALDGVKVILAAGEVLPGSLVEEMGRTYDIRMYNGYGPTEATIGATITEAGDMVSIGKPIGNAGIVLLTGNRKPVPFGAMGEICIYGKGVGVGYRNRLEETAEKYIEWEGLRLYRTGDLGHFLPDGRLIYHGRNDRQIKLRGLRIELSEIEKVMGSVPGIALCNCIVREIEKREHLVGFYTVAAGACVDVRKLKNILKSSLTSYMVPEILKELPQMPQTPNGKTDLKALALEPVEYVRTYKKPVTHREVTVCQAFERVLDVKKIGLDDNFFELGGSSLDAAEVLLNIEGSLGLKEGVLDFGDLYKYPTPSLLLEKIFGNVDEDVGFDLKSQDYSGIDSFLQAHTKDSVEKRNLGNILITGVTGYFGAHLLIDLLQRPQLYDKVVCLVRSTEKLTAEKRVKMQLFYYAEQDFSESYGSKWMVAEGDITEPEILKEKLDVSFDTIINSAANVAHFAYGDALTSVNTDGVKNLIAFARKQQAVLCQISTISVAGSTSKTEEEKVFTERQFYIGQEIHNSYIYSKYMAEHAMLRAAVDDGLRIKLLRVGNLQGRIADGEFQMNMHSNAFMRRMSSYIKVGAVPESIYHATVNFSPVDETAHNIVSLIATGDDTVAFNVYPAQEVAFKELFQGLEKLGHNVEILTDDEFAALLQKKKQTEDGREQIEGLFTAGAEGRLRDIPVTQEITDSYIRQLGDKWSQITEDYIDQCLSTLDEMALF